MIKNKLEKTKNSIYEYKRSNGISDTEMASMYDIHDTPSDIIDDTLADKNRSAAKGTVRILNDNMTSMYNMLKNK